jgi:hypothetical protein
MGGVLSAKPLPPPKMSLRFRIGREEALHLSFSIVLEVKLSGVANAGPTRSLYRVSVTQQRMNAKNGKLRRDRYIDHVENCHT